MRAKLEALMKPDPQRAAQLRAHFQDGFREIAKRLWPHLNLVLAVDSGSNQIYGEMLRESYCKGVPFYSPFYAATEGTFTFLSCLIKNRCSWAFVWFLYVDEVSICSHYLGPCRFNWGEPVASGVRKTLLAVPSLNVLRVPPREQPG